MNAQATAIVATDTPKVAAPELKVAAELQTVTVPSGLRIDKAAAKSHSHYAIAGVLASPSADDGQVYLSATNGHTLAIVQVAGHVDAPSIIPQAVISRRKSESRYTLADDTWQNVGEHKIAPAQQGNFPKVIDVIPDLADAPKVLTLDVKLLADLASMIASDGKVTMMIGGGEYGKPIAVRGIDGFGVIMPCESPTECVGGYRRDRSDFAAAWK